MRKRLLSMLLVIVMLMSFSLSFTVAASEMDVTIAFYDVMTKQEINSLEGVGSTYAKISFVSPTADTAHIMCVLYDGDDKLLKTEIFETISTATDYTTENIDLTGARTIKLFVFDNTQNLVPLCASKVLTRTTDDGTVSLAFDNKSLITAGAYDPDVYVEADIQGAYDDTVKSVTSGISGVKYVNNNKPISSTDVYSNRDFVYTTVDLSDKLPAKKVVVNFKCAVKAPSGTIYVNQVDGYPAVGETMDVGTRLSSAKMSGSYDEAVYKEYACDVTEAYNKAIGSKLYLKIYGWYGNTERYNNIIRLNTTSIALSVTPATGDDFKVTFNEGAEEISVGVYEEITLPECTNVIAGRKFAGWSDGKNVYQAGDKYTVRSSVAFTATYEKDPETYTAAQKALDGKTVMFIGNSYVYYGNCVLQKGRTQYTWDDRKNDKGYFYQLCKLNNVDVTVRNWCFSGHTLSQTFNGACTSSYAACAGVNHEDHMEDKYVDYVIISPHASSGERDYIESNFEYVMNFFREHNPNVKFVCLGNHAVYGVTNTGYTYPGITDYYKTLEEKGVIIADWGKIVKDIVDGNVSVPGATQTYNKNTFVNTNDGYHQNALSGYLTTLAAYCAITEDSAVGQPYEFCGDSTINSKFDLIEYRSQYYANAADTNFIEVFNSAADMLGLQKLVDMYVNPEEVVPVTLTLADCDNAGTTTYDKGSEITLPTPVKSAKGGKYTFKHWTDTAKTYAAGDKIELTDDLTLTAVWDYESAGVTEFKFDSINIAVTGAWNTETSAYDDTVTSISKNVTGLKEANVRKPYNSTQKAYQTRQWFYTEIDLKNEKQAEQVLLNFLGTSSNGTIYVYTADKIPEVGEERILGTLVGSKKVTGNLQTMDITEEYNAALGSKLYLAMYGWAWAEEKYRNYVKLNADTLSLDVTPYVEGKYTVTFNEGAETIYADRNAEITLPEYSLVIPGQKFTGWSDGTNTYQSGATYAVTKTTRFTAVVVDDPDSMTNAQKLLHGKKAIFIGDSNVYYGRAVEARSSKNTLAERQNDKGIFYQICKANGCEVSVTNWTYGSHGWRHLFDTTECTVNDTCGGINHEEALTDHNYDYVFLGLTRSAVDEENLDAYMTKITGIFREANPNVQIIVLAPTMIYGISDTGTVRQGTIDSLKTMETKYNVKVADWGRIVYDILEGNTAVPETAQQWEKSTFVIKDKKHVNLLGGYMTALMAYCVVTGDKAEGQNYDFFEDASLAPVIDVQGYVETYYTNGDADSNFPEILASETEMLGIQKLIDKYIAEKPYLGADSESVTLTLTDCDNAGTTTYDMGTEITLSTPVKSAKGGKYTFKHWTDTAKTYAAGEVIELTGDITLTAVWDYESYGVITMNFDDVVSAVSGAYDSSTQTYNNIVTDVASGVSDVKYVNANQPKNSSGYQNRRWIYTEIDLANEKKAEEVLLNYTASTTGSTAYIYVYTAPKIPSVGEERVLGTQIGSRQKVTGSMQTIDITDEYNEAIGSKLYLVMYGWYGNAARNINAVSLNTDTLSLDVTPYVEGKYTVTFNEGAEPIYAAINSEIALPEYSIKIPGQKFTGWSDGTNTYQAGATYTVTKTTRFTALIEEDPDSMTEAQKLLDGKKIIFIGNSHTYYGRTVKAPPKSNELSARTDDTGGFYQLCKQNYIDVSVTNWTFGSHGLESIFGGEACSVNDSCGGVIHKDKLTDNNYDYVVIQPGTGNLQDQTFADNVKTITDFFTAGNPNVKIIILGTASLHGINATDTVYPTIPAQYKDFYNQGYPIADWGYLVKNIINGTETVPGATQTYNKNTFIVKDKYHPNLLTGYITTLFTYCAITGEKAEGQPYMYFWNSTTAPAEVESYVTNYYTNGDADTTFPEILKSEADIRGIQKLIDKYIEEKAFLDQY